MHITHVESFKTWLVENIRPLCDADPVPLSKYVLALVKKDKDEKELKSICNDQLDVFFQENTVEFVEKLFLVLKDESYSRPPAPPAAPVAATAVAPVTSASDEEHRSATKRKASAGSAATVAKQSSKELYFEQQQQQQHHHPPDSKVARVSSTDKPSAVELAQPTKKLPPVPILPPSPPALSVAAVSNAGGSVAAAPASSSSSSSSKGGTVGPPKDLRNTLNSRSTSSGRAAHQHQQQQQQHHQHQHPLPPHQLQQQPPPAVSAYQHQFLPPPMPPHSLPPVSSGVGYYPPMPPPPHPHPQMMMPPHMPPPHQLPQHPQRPRCRDYDEKGVCLLGAACPFDHGAHPFTVTPGDPAYGKFFPGMLPPPPPLPLASQAPLPQSQHHGMMAPTYSTAPLTTTTASQQQQQQQSRQSSNAKVMEQHQQLPQAAASAAASTVPSAAIPGRIVQPIEQVPQPQQQQHLPPAPAAAASVAAAAFPSNRHHRGGGAAGGGGFGQPSCALELRRVPPELNNVTALSDHFCRFGDIQDIETAAGGDPEAARIIFAAPSEALAAYRSPEAVLNNRFIRMFLPGAGGGGGPRPSARERLGARQQQQQQQQQPTRRRSNLRQMSTGSSGEGGGDDASAAGGDALDESSMASLQPPAPSRAALTWTPQSTEVAAKAAEAAAAAAAERRQEGARIQQAQRVALERAKAHRELRVKQIRMLKDCKDSLAKLGTLFSRAKDADSRHAIAETMKPINAQIRDLESSLGVVSTGSAALRDLQKELLDLELEVYQKEGLEPVTEQRKRLAEVRKLLAARLPPKPAPAAAPVPNFAQTRLDKRSRTLRIVGHSAAQVDDLLRHIAVQAGVKPQRHQQCPSSDGGGGGPHLLVDFAARADAEAAMARLRTFEDKPLKVEWSQAMAAPPPPAAAAADAVPAAAANAE